MYRRLKNGKRVGPYYINVGGRRVSSGTDDRERAKRKEQKDNARIWDQRHGFAILTWDEACNKWIQDNPDAWALYHNQQHMAWWRERLTGKSLPDINRSLVHELVTELGANVTTRVPQNATANGYVSFVARIVEHGLGVRPKLLHYPKIQYRERLLKPEEWAKLIPVFDQDTADALTFLLATGQREGCGVIRLEWGWLDGATAVVPALEMKMDKPHAFPLNQTAMAVLERRRQAQVKHVRLVFTRDGGKPWYRKKLIDRLHDACGAAGVEDLVPHGLRHAFNSWLAKAAVPREVRKRLLGHSGNEVHDGYTHLDVEDLRPACEVIDRVIAAALLSQSKASA